MKILELTEVQKQHLAWRLDHKTGCGLLTACAVAQGQHGNLDLIDVFMCYGGKSRRSAMIHAKKVEKFSLPYRLPSILRELADTLEEGAESSP